MTTVITGGSAGLGKCIMGALSEGEDVINWDLATGVDVSASVSVDRAARALYSAKIDVLINNAGTNHLAPLAEYDEQDWDRVMNTNAKSIYLVTRALLENLRGGTILNIVSNAAHLPFTNSIAYNASKGAAHIMTRQLARELFKSHNITVFGIAPNRLANTTMSETITKRVCALRGWTKEEADDYQRSTLPCGEETDPVELAEFIAYLLSTKGRHKYLHSCILEYGR